jgi:cell division protein FtsW (lipid II flippase)
MFSAGYHQRENSRHRAVAMTLERIFTILSGVLLLVALFLLWRNNLSAAFVIATLGVVAWFLSYRMQLRAKIPVDAPIQAENESDED